jgi:putative ATP-binding cassette transporter
MTGRPALSVGPFRLSFAAGETVFIVGGNGSGKSTLMKLLTGLYAPHSGALLVDGVRLQASHYAGYRELFPLFSLISTCLTGSTGKPTSTRSGSHSSSPVWSSKRKLLTPTGTSRI